MNLQNHTLKAYDQQLSQLMQLILDMGAEVKGIILSTKRALKDRRPELVDEAAATDKRINALEGKLEEAATITLALQNPLAVDLRFVTSALKSSGVLERAGDLAKNIIKRSISLGDYQSPETFGKLEAMADTVVSMLDDALRAIEHRDAERALAVWKRDDEVDELYHTIFATMQREMLADANKVPACTHVVFIAKNFERLADYTTNLAKTVYYVATGKPAEKSLIRGDKT